MVVASFLLEAPLACLRSYNVRDGISASRLISRVSFIQLRRCRQWLGIRTCVGAGGIQFRFVRVSLVPGVVRDVAWAVVIRRIVRLAGDEIVLA